MIMISFEQWIRNRVTHRTNDFWKDEKGVVHMMGREPNLLTECGLEGKAVEYYRFLDPKDAINATTCPECCKIIKDLP